MLIRQHILHWEKTIAEEGALKKGKKDGSTMLANQTQNFVVKDLFLGRGRVKSREEY